VVTVLVVWGVLGLALWWSCGGHPFRAGTAPASRPSAPPVPARPQGRRPARPGHRSRPARLPLTEDDLIAFGLALEASCDVVGSLGTGARQRALRL
jgi:hypothetical protein